MPSCFIKVRLLETICDRVGVLSLRRILQKDKLHNSVCAVQSSEDDVLFLYMETKLE